MPRKLSFVNIPYEDSREFETFLYDQVKYPTHGYVRYNSNDKQVYVLDLEDGEAIMICLRFQGARIEPFSEGLI